MSPFEKYLEHRREKKERERQQEKEWAEAWNKQAAEYQEQNRRSEVARAVSERAEKIYAMLVTEQMRPGATQKPLEELAEYARSAAQAYQSIMGAK